MTLSALNQALEPDRPSRENPVFVIRNGDHYQLNPHIQYFLDLDEFEKLALSPNLNEREEALLLYKGRLLEGEALQEFFMPEMQYFHRLYLDCLGKVIDATMQEKDFDRCLELSNRLVRQEPLLAAGYHYQMRIYHAVGNTPMIQKVYQQALAVSHKEYGPGSEPEDLKQFYEELMGL